MNETAYIMSRTGAWHVLITDENAERAITDCGLALTGGLIDTLPPNKPKRRPCEACNWPDGYPKWSKEQ